MAEGDPWSMGAERGASSHSRGLTERGVRARRDTEHLIREPCLGLGTLRGTSLP